MPAGPSIIGGATFLAIKFLGYRYAGVKLNAAYAEIPPVPPNLFGAIRAGLGLIVGVGFAVTAMQWNVSHAEILWFVLLLPVRLLEWSLVIWIFYERKLGRVNHARFTRCVMVGSLWSFILDLPATLSMIVVPGGMWIC
jgi:hypothetical protein